jgi:2-polyprenyl-3-methyl-5-hydroxy-6-metoxy-1,4-benzoquinol methylase
LLFAYPLPTDQELNAFYAEGYFSSGSQQGTFGYENYADRNSNLPASTAACYERHEATLLRYVDKQVKLLDVGCATGAFLIFLRNRGWTDLSGIEFSQHAATIGQSFELKVAVGRIDDADYPDGHFDVVFTHMVIEHVKDPQSFMKAVRRVLRPGGLFICGTVNFGNIRVKLLNCAASFGRPVFTEIKPPEHLLMYSKTSLRTLVELHGFKTIDLSDPNGTCLSDVRFNNTVLNAASRILRPVLKHISADFEIRMVASKL